MYSLNQRAGGLSCLRCGTRYELSEFDAGCAACARLGYPVSLKVDYAGDIAWAPNQVARGMARHAARLPFLTFPTLGEGETPISPLAELAGELGIVSVWIKNEGLNPTGSHKDRMSAQSVAHAVSLRKRAVAAASTGNAGVSLAAYAAAANIPCFIVTTADIGPRWARAVERHGATLVYAENPKERWNYIKRMVAESGWYSVTNYRNPPIGSAPFGVQGYKTIGFEIVEQLKEDMPTVVLVPCSRGDLLWGIGEGLAEAQKAGVIKTLPRLIAVEPFPRLRSVLGGADYREEFTGESRLTPSIGGTTVTFQSVAAIRASGGSAVVASGQEAVSAQEYLTRLGIVLERSSAAVLAGLRKLVSAGDVSKQDRVLMIGTSSGGNELPS